MIYSFSCVKMPPKISDEKIRILIHVVQANKIELNGQICTDWEKVSFISNSNCQVFFVSNDDFFRHVFAFQGCRRI